MAQEPRELDAARMAIVALLAVTTDEQFRSVETALEALGAMSETAPAALEELRLARSRRGSGDDIIRALEVRLAVRERRR